MNGTTVGGSPGKTGEPLGLPVYSSISVALAPDPWLICATAHHIYNT